MAELDLRNISTEDLVALQNAINSGDLSQIPDETLQGVLGQLDQAQTQSQQDPALVRGVRSGLRWMTQSDTQPNIPTLGQGTSLDIYDISPSQKAGLFAAITTTVDDERLGKSIQNIMGDTPVELQKDQYGNLVVMLPVKGKNYMGAFYPNPKGFDVPTATQLAGGVAVGGPIYKLASKILPVIGVAPESFLGTSLVGGTEATGYEMASARLADEPMSFSPTLWGSIFGGAISTVIRGLGAAGNAISNRFRNYIDILDPETGNLTLDAQRFLRANGLNPDDVRSDIFAEIKRRVEAGAVPAAAQTAAQAGGLPVPIPLTQGQGPTGSTQQQIFESQVLAGDFGETAQNIMQAQASGQQQAIRQNIPLIQERLGGAPIQPRAGAAQAQETLSAMQEAAKQQAGELFTVARKGNSYTNPFQTGDFGTDIIGQMSDFNRITAPKTFGILDEIDEAFKQGKSIKDIYAYRSQLSNQATAVGEERGAAGAALRFFDQKLDEIADNTLLYGSPDQIRAWSAAIKNYREYMRKWETEGILKNLTQKTERDGVTVLAVDPNDAANQILGASFGGVISKRNMARDLLTLKRELPEADWNAIRQEAFLKLANNMKGAFDEGVEVSATNFRNVWNKAKTENPDVIKVLFNPEEIKLINDFANVSYQATTRAANYSNTASAMNNIMTRFMGALGVGDMVNFLARIQVTDTLRQAYGQSRARKATMQAAESVRGRGLLDQPGAYGMFGGQSAPGITEFMSEGQNQ